MGLLYGFVFIISVPHLDGYRLIRLVLSFLLPSTGNSWFTGLFCRMCRWCQLSMTYWMGAFGIQVRHHRLYPASPPPAPPPHPPSKTSSPRGSNAALVSSSVLDFFPGPIPSIAVFFLSKPTRPPFFLFFFRTRVPPPPPPFLLIHSSLVRTTVNERERTFSQPFIRWCKASVRLESAAARTHSPIAPPHPHPRKRIVFSGTSH